MVGCGVSSSPSPNPTIKVAILTPMTGELATFGEMTRNGITMAFDEWNDRGGVKSRHIEWVLEDTRCDPLTAREAAKRVIVEQGVRFLVGGVCSEAAIPIAHQVEEEGALFIAATATHPLVTVDETGAVRWHVFRAGYVHSYQGQAAARFALEKLNARHAAVLLNPADDFVRSAAKEFITTFVADGGEVVAQPTYTSSQMDFEAILAEVTQSQPEVLYVPADYSVANRVGQQTQSLEVTLIGSELWDNDALDLSALEGAYFTLHYRPETPNPLAEAWAEQYLSAFALEPDTLSALGYDAANLLASGLASAETATPEAVARRLETMEFEGVTGRWRFDRQHNPLKPVVVVRVEREGVRFFDLVQPR